MTIILYRHKNGKSLYEWPDYMTHCHSQRNCWKTHFPCYFVQQDASTDRADQVTHPRSAIAWFTEKLRADLANESGSGRGGRSPGRGILAFPCKVNLSKGWGETLCEVTWGWLLPGISSCISNKAVMRLNFCCWPVRFGLADVEVFRASMNLRRQTGGSLRGVGVVDVSIQISIMAVQISIDWYQWPVLYIYMYWLLYLNNNRAVH